MLRRAGTTGPAAVMVSRGRFDETANRTEAMTLPGPPTGTCRNNKDLEAFANCRGCNWMHIQHVKVQTCTRPCCYTCQELGHKRQGCTDRNKKKKIKAGEHIKFKSFTKMCALPFDFRVNSWTPQFQR